MGSQVSEQGRAGGLGPPGHVLAAAPLASPFGLQALSEGAGLWGLLQPGAMWESMVSAFAWGGAGASPGEETG